MQYLGIEDIAASVPPYTNHIGRGHNIGAGDDNGKGRASSYTSYNENYSGADIKSFNGHKTYMLDGYLLYITHVHYPWASAKIIKNDLTTQDCYLGKINKHIVVAASIHEALNALREKINQSDDNDNDIAQAFVHAHPCYDKEYDWDEMVFWHSLSHSSCKLGRNNFSKNANKEPGSKATPKELIEFMKHTRAGNIAKIMEKLYLSQN